MKFIQFLSLNNYLHFRPLGSGRFGKVYLAYEKKSEYEILVAIKIMFKSMLTRNLSEKVLKSEVEIQSSLNHPNILSLYTWFHDNTKIYLVIEFAVNGSVLKKLDKEKQLIDTVASSVSLFGGKDLINLKKLFFTSTFIKQQKH